MLYFINKVKTTIIKFLTNITCYVKISITGYGRLAQLVEHSLDVRVVRDSSSLSSTIGGSAEKAETDVQSRLFALINLCVCCKEVFEVGKCL